LLKQRIKNFKTFEAKRKTMQDNVSNSLQKLQDKPDFKDQEYPYWKQKEV